MTTTSTRERFIVAPVANGYQAYDTERHEHLGRVRSSSTDVAERLDAACVYRPEIVRWILTGIIS